MGHEGFRLPLMVLGLAAVLPAPLFESPPAHQKQEATAPPAGLTRGDWAQIQRSIREAEYHAAPVVKPDEAPSFVAPNRAQGYRATFRSEGVEIVPKAHAHASWRLAVFVTGYGYEGDVRPLPAAEPKADKERVEYRRGPVTEWYVNRPGGLEQGFTIAEPQAQGNGPIVLAMAVKGDLDARVEDASEASFRDGAGETRVRYAGLAAWDADGQPLASRLEASQGELRVVVEAGRARFPVTVDPTFVQEARLVASDGGAEDRFGGSVSVDGDTAVVGAYLNAGAGSAYVFVRSGTVWSEQQKLVAPDGAYGDQFGSSVSVSGDTAVVGAFGDETAGGLGAGSAYVFVRSGTVWSEQQKLVASDGATGDWFGYSVSVSGDTAVVGAHRAATAGGARAGAAYVFVRSGMVWSEQQKLVASDGAAYDGFGLSVSVSADTAVVGAPGDDTAGGVSAGSAYVFVRSGTVWSQQQMLVASDGAGADGFGVSVSVFGDTAVVGASGDDTAGGVNAGSAYVFVRSGTVWSEQQKLLASDGATGDWFGSSVSVSGDTAVVGDPYEDTAGGVEAGAAYVFREATADLSVTKTDGLAAVPPGGTVTYTITVSNAGPGAVTGALVADIFPPILTCTTTCSGTGGATCTAGPFAGNINDSASIPAVQSVTYTSTCTISAAATGTLVNTASVAAPPGVTDPAPGNNTATDTDTLTPQADLQAAKTDSQASAVPGLPVTYLMTVTNAGPSNVTGATVTDTVPGILTGVTWTCAASGGSSCPTSGSGSISHAVDVAAGGVLSYALTGTLSASVTGTLSNTVTVTAPGGVTDPVGSNNSATDTDTLTPTADLGVTKTDGQSHATPGGGVTYTIVASNPGPSDAPTSTVADTFPVSITGVTWTCAPAGGASCGGSGGSGDINRVVDLPAGGSVTFVASGTVDAGATGTLVNTATVTSSVAVTDPELSDNAATDVDNLTIPGISELSHGVARVRSLESTGPGTPANLFRIRQEARSSYEVVVDGVTGDVASPTGTGPNLQRLGADATTVLQTAVAAGAGASRSLRFENTSAAAREDEFVRVESAGCTSACGPEDVYRIRAWDTTLLAPRFNNSATQVTVLVLQNGSAAAVAGHVHFWSAAGAHLATRAFSLGPRAALVMNTATVAGVSGHSGTITLSHDGAYGTLTGKAVAVEPATGFTFDTAMTPRR